MKLDVSDSLGLLGLVLLAVAVGVTWGPWALLGLLGGVLIVVSLVMAMRDSGAKAK